MRLVGCNREEPNYPYPTLTAKCELCHHEIEVTYGASFAARLLEADGYACFACLDQQPEHVAQKA